MNQSYAPERDGVEVTGAQIVVLSGKVTIENGVVLIDGMEVQVDSMTFELQPGQVLAVLDVSALEEGESAAVVVKRPEPRDPDA